MTSRTTDLTRRAVGPDDLAAVTSLLTASDESVLGHRDFTDEEIAADLRRADLESYGWYAADGTLVGYGWVSRIERSDRVEVDGYVLPTWDESLGLEMFAQLEERGRSLAADAGHHSVLFDIGVYRQDEKSRGWMTGRDFEVATTFTRMRIDLAGPVEPAEGPRPVTVRRTNGSDDELRVAHRIDEESFVDHYGNVATSYERWRERLTERGEDWATVWLAELDGEPVGVLVGTPQFEQDENAGYVRTLGTLPSARGRGVAKAMLRAYFDASQRAGRVAVLLHVDVANVTDALGVYESVGMRSVLEIDAWNKRVPVGSA